MYAPHSGQYIPAGPGAAWSIPNAPVAYIAPLVPVPAQKATMPNQPPAALAQISRLPSTGKTSALRSIEIEAPAQPVDENEGRRTRGRGFSVVFAKGTADPKAKGRFRPLTIIACLRLDRDLGVEDVRRLLKERLVEKFPKFRCRVEFKGVFAQYFEELPLSAIDMDYHVKAETSQGWGQAEIDSLFTSLYAEDKDYSRPLWKFHVLNGLAAGGSMLVANIDHAMGDGIGMIQVLISLLDSAPGTSGPEPSVAIAKGESSPSGGTTPTGGLVVKAKPTKLGAMRWLKTQMKGTAQGLGQIFMFKDRKTVMLVKDIFHPSKARNFAVSEKISLQKVKDIKNKMEGGGSVNDVIATTINLALKRYLQERGDAIVNSKSKIKANYPVNLRRPGQTQIANEFATSLLALDFDYQSRTEVLFRIKSRMDENKVSPQPIIERALLKVAARLLPTNTLLNLAIWLFTKFSIMMSNVPGPASLQHFGGATLTDLYYFLFVPLGVYVGTLSYNGQVTFTIAADPEVETEPAKFIKYISSEFEELHKEAMAAPTLAPATKRSCC